MIFIGLTGWGDHDSLYTELSNKKDKLMTYASHFPIVELDATYYAIQRTSTIEKWCQETPESFKFVVKAHQFMTGHSDYRDYYDSIKDVFIAFKDMLKPMQERNKLAFVLLQFPPWFDCTSKNIRYVKFATELLKPYKIAVEFRNQTWFQDEYKEETLSFLHDSELIHSICDEPNAGIGSIPFVNRVTDDIAFIRLHGRNVHGWTQQNRTSDEWREVRYLYDYNKDELAWLKRQVDILKHKTKHIYIVFNNNSGGHAAGNAKTFIDLMDIEYSGLFPKQLKLF
ncbi:DUF72 domain-containing protein [Jeotgalicoccus huakuii]|uniref:DUF72 domain-containing protein n=1 Tax=Jeotgalicoccus TaxID=227979 RepID=UPI000414C0FB|nr:MULTISPECIES: DUF72 domain-containing protein [Jeotgalicoccus]MCK1976318.1 DUF72 domain-containing protein [Jeotgalicoccus huakuii]QQD85964.1 DUF72 domain-containing protein [Jeotgalicoccus sp. ATCC 8456]